MKEAEETLKKDHPRCEQEFSLMDECIRPLKQSTPLKGIRAT